MEDYLNNKKWKKTSTKKWKMTLKKMEDDPEKNNGKQHKKIGKNERNKSWG
jgi:hypothetical protein